MGTREKVYNGICENECSTVSLNGDALSECDYYIRGQAKRDFRKGCDAGSNPYDAETEAAEIYDNEMQELFEEEEYQSLRGLDIAPY